MSIGPGEIQRLRKHFQSISGMPVSDDSPCEEAAHIWDAVHGHLETDALKAVVQHVAVCQRCTEAWRLASALSPTQSKPRRAPWLERAVAAAAGILLVVGIGLHNHDRSTEVRSGDGQTVEIKVERVTASDPSRSGELVVRWQAIEDARYNIEVRRLVDGAQVFERLSLGRPEARISLESLAATEVRLGTEIEILIKAYRTGEGTLAEGRRVLRVP